MKTKKNTSLILTIMNVLAWIVCSGFIVKAGAMIISYGVSIKNPEGAKNLYMGLNLYNVKQFDFWQYTGIVLLLVSLELIKAYVAFLVTRVLSKIRITNPFTIQVSKILDMISYFILFTWAVAMLYNGYITWLAKQIPGLQQNLIAGDFILQAGVVFVFAQIFKKGVEIQTENELTV